MKNKRPINKKTVLANKYSPNHLLGIPREESRIKNKIDDFAYKGFDVWNCYELGWLDKDGKPEVRRIKIIYPALSRSCAWKLRLRFFARAMAMSTARFLPALYKEYVRIDQLGGKPSLTSAGRWRRRGYCVSSNFG